MSIQYVKGDLFQVLKNASKEPIIVAHACNCMGVWGGGIAYVFKQRFASAYTLYHQYCNEYGSNPEALLGTSFLLPVRSNDRMGSEELEKKAIIVCLFTSVMGSESPGEIAGYTRSAMLDLKRQLESPEHIHNDVVRKIIQKNDGSNYVVSMPKINAGIFGVPWQMTENALNQTGLDCVVFEL